MANKPKAPRRKSSNYRPFLDLLGQMEELFRVSDLDWPPDIAADARRRLTRLQRGIKLAPEGRDRM
jgi:hypothetical protein